VASKLRIRIGVVISLLFIVTVVQAQPMVNGKSIGMSGANVLQMRAAQAVGWNPANLVFPGQPGSTVVFSSFGYVAGNNTLSYSDILNTFQSGKVLEDGDVDQFTGLFDGDLSAYGLGTVTIAGLTVRNFAVNFDLQNLASATVSPDMAKLLMNGVELNDRYTLGNIGFEVSSCLVSSASAAFTVKPPAVLSLSHLSVGGTVKWYKWIGYYGLTGNSGHIQVTYDGFDTQGRFTLASASSGNGLGLDLGVMGESKKLKMAFGVTLGNLMGNMKWSDATVTRYELNFPVTIDPGRIDEKSYWDGILTHTETTGETFSKPLPRYMLFSARKNLDDFKVVAYGSYYQGLNDVPGNSMIPRIALGGEWQGFKNVPLRSGIAIGGMERFAFSLGVGFSYNTYRLDIGTAWQMGLLNSARGYSFGLNNYFVIP